MRIPAAHSILCRVEPWPSTDRKGVIADAVEGLLGLGLSGALIAFPVLTAIVLAVLGTDLLVSLASMVVGMVAGWLAMTVFMIVGMGLFSGSADDVAPGPPSPAASAGTAGPGERLFGVLIVIVPALVAIGATLIGTQVLAGVSRLLIGVAVVASAVVVITAVAIARVRQSAGDAARRVKWLRDRDAGAARDPEFAEKLRMEGWRVDGPYDEMRAVYFRTWNVVKEARRASGRPIWGKGDDPVEPPRNR